MNAKVIFGFDMETDIGSWTPYYNGLIHGTPRILDTLAENGILTTFFFTGSAAKSHPEIVKMVDNAGHEVACHGLNHESLGSAVEPMPNATPIIPEECYYRIKIAVDIIQQVVGEKITSFRGPRLWGSTTMLNVLEDLGFTADSTYPMYHYKERLMPYHPNQNDWTAEGDMKILEIPVTASICEGCNDSSGNALDLWPLFRTDGAETVMVHIDNMFKLYEQKKLPAVFCFYMHPWEFHEMPQEPIHFAEGTVIIAPHIIKNCGEVALCEFKKLVAMLNERGVEFSRACEIAEHW